MNARYGWCGLLSLCLIVFTSGASAADGQPAGAPALFPSHDVELEFDNPYEAGVHLAGTLTLPEGNGPFPAVVLISGTGLQDRDETIFGHKPFLAIADYLARRGIASLRVDDRMTGRSRGEVATATTENFARDVRAELEVLRARPEIDPARVGLIGHSEGAVIGPMLAADPANHVAYMVLLAGVGVRGITLLHDQNEDGMLAAGVRPEVVKTLLSLNDSLYRAVLASKADGAALTSELAAVLRENSPQFDEVTALRSVAVLTTPSIRYFLALDPVPALTRTRCPVLALNGDKDTQVRASTNLPAIEAALKAGGNQDVTIRTMPGLNHLFQTAVTGAANEYATIQENFSPDALKVMGDWLEAHVALPGQ